jgi:Tol biopolymer transport system component
MKSLFAFAAGTRAPLWHAALTLSVLLAGCQDAPPPPVAPHAEIVPAAPSTGGQGQIVFESSRSNAAPDLYTLDLATGRTQRLTRDRVSDMDPAWSPDGQRIAFTTSRGLGRHVYVMSATGEGLTRVSTTTAPNSQPSWSPDGTKLLYTTQGGGSGDIVLALADGSGTLAILAGNPAADFDPAWSPTSYNGVKFAFTSMRDNGSGDIYTYDDSQTPNVRRLTVGGARQPAWSPDGTKIAYVVWHGRGFDVFVTNADGTGTPTNLTKSSADNEMPAWSSDGKKIAFVSNRDGKHHLYTMNPDGSGVARLTRGGDSDSAPSWKP